MSFLHINFLSGETILINHFRTFHRQCLKLIKRADSTISYLPADKFQADTISKMRYNKIIAGILALTLFTIISCKQHQPQQTDNGNMALGNPSNASNSLSNANNYLIDHKYFVESYNRDKAEPNWVSWHLCASDLGATDRLNNFRPDETLPDGWYEADNNSYKRSGFDKGHNCPSGDRTSTPDANSATFLMDNIIPQAPNNNQHTWEHLESYCRDKVKKGNELYIVMGAYGSGGTGRNGYSTVIDGGKINVPAHIWKVVVILPEGDDDLARIDGSTQIIAIDTPNDNNISNNWMNYTCTVRDIEAATGYNLLSALPQTVQDELKTRKFTGGN